MLSDIIGVVITTLRGCRKNFSKGKLVLTNNEILAFFFMECEKMVKESFNELSLFISICDIVTDYEI